MEAQQHGASLLVLAQARRPKERPVGCGGQVVREDVQVAALVDARAELAARVKEEALEARGEGTLADGGRGDALAALRVAVLAIVQPEGAEVEAGQLDGRAALAIDETEAQVDEAALEQRDRDEASVVRQAVEQAGVRRAVGGGVADAKIEGLAVDLADAAHADLGVAAAPRPQPAEVVAQQGARLDRHRHLALRRALKGRRRRREHHCGRRRLLGGAIEAVAGELLRRAAAQDHIGAVFAARLAWRALALAAVHAEGRRGGRRGRRRRKGRRRRRRERAGGDALRLKREAELGEPLHGHRRVGPVHALGQRRRPRDPPRHPRLANKGRGRGCRQRRLHLLGVRHDADGVDHRHAVAVGHGNSVGIIDVVVQGLIARGAGTTLRGLRGPGVVSSGRVPGRILPRIDDTVLVTLDHVASSGGGGGGAGVACGAAPVPSILEVAARARRQVGAREAAARAPPAERLRCGGRGVLAALQDGRGEHGAGAAEAARAREAAEVEVSHRQLQPAVGTHLGEGALACRALEPRTRGPLARHGAAVAATAQGLRRG